MHDRENRKTIHEVKKMLISMIVERGGIVNVYDNDKEKLMDEERKIELKEGEDQKKIEEIL